MAQQPKIEIILDLECKIYELNRHVTVWHKSARVGMLEVLEDGTFRVGGLKELPEALSQVSQPPVFSNRREALELLVRLWRISNPVQSDVAYQRTAMNILGVEIWVHAFKLSPDLAVWTTENGQPLGTLHRSGANWARGCSDEAKTFLECLEEMVREFQASQPQEAAHV